MLATLMPRRPACDKALSPPEDVAFARWLNDRLGKLYGAVLNEPVPDNLLALLKPPKK